MCVLCFYLFYNRICFISIEHLTKCLEFALCNIVNEFILQERWLDITVIPHTTWNEAKLVVKILLAYFSLNIIRVDLLFYLMCAFSIRMVLDFQVNNCLTVRMRSREHMYNIKTWFILYSFFLILVTMNNERWNYDFMNIIMCTILVFLCEIFVCRSLIITKQI